MRTSLLPDVIDSLVTMSNADATLTGLGVAVYDGPTIQGDPAQSVLWIGMNDPDENQAPEAGQVDQRFPGLGTRRKDEDGTVNCVAEAWTGDREIKAIRDKVYAIVAAVEEMVRLDATLGGVLTSAVGWAQVSSGTLKQNNVDSGAVARLSFHISYRGRI